ncbi:MAG: transcriptional repressor [Clostridia bacterium]
MMRNTIQRQIVLNTVHSLKNHPTADDIYNEIFREHPTISRGTVYRNLNILAETGQVQKVSMPDSADRFDHTLYKHYHIKCTECDCFFDVDIEYIQEINDIISEKTGFELQAHEIVFKGVCPDCKE